MDDVLPWVMDWTFSNTNQMKKRSDETQTLRAGCSKAEPKIFAPPQTLLPGDTGRPKFNQLEMVMSLPTNPVWWGSMHAVSSYRGNRPTNKHTNRQDRLQYTAPQLARSVTNQHKTCGMRCAVRPPVRTLLYSHAHPSYLLVMPATVMTAGLFCPWQYSILNALNTRTSGVTPIGQGWTNARALRDLGGPKLDPIFLYILIFQMSGVSHLFYSTADFFLWTSYVHQAVIAFDQVRWLACCLISIFVYLQ